MNIDNFILICIFISISIITFIIFYNTGNSKQLYEGLDPNIAGVNSDEKMTIGNLDVTKNLNVTGVTAVNDINVINIITPVGKVDITPSNELNEDGKKGCYYEPIKFRDPFPPSNIADGWPDSYSDGVRKAINMGGLNPGGIFRYGGSVSSMYDVDPKHERGYILDAFCKKGYYMAGFKQSVSEAKIKGIDTFYRGYNLLCCPFITK